MKIVRSWREQKAMLRKLFPSLKDEDIAFDIEQKESMFAKLQVRLNKSREELEFIFAELKQF